MDNKISKLIKEIRTKNNLTQQEFASMFGVTYQAVSKWENGKNIPDISILKEICKKYDLSIDEFLDTKTNKKNNKFLFIIGGLLLVIISLFFIFYDRDSFEFKTISADCNDFTLTGSIAYDKNKSSIYISHIIYCGKENKNKYTKLIATIYESNDNINSKVSTNTLVSDEGKTLEEYLKDITFNVDHYEKSCSIYKEDSLYLEIEVTPVKGDIQTYKIPLKLDKNC